MLLPTDRILIVDDNCDAASSLGILLRLRGGTVQVVHDGPAALAEIDRFQPTAVLLDLGMPGMDGFEVAQRIRMKEDLDSLVLVAQTGWGNQEFRRRSQEVGFNYHLVKPVEFESLVSLLVNARASAGQTQ
jgi:CheY-like chemotaxis protein